LSDFSVFKRFFQKINCFKQTKTPFLISSNFYSSHNSQITILI
jgi:hypothetical protein